MRWSAPWRSAPHPPLTPSVLRLTPARPVCLRGQKEDDQSLDLVTERNRAMIRTATASCLFDPTALNRATPRRSRYSRQWPQRLSTRSAFYLARELESHVTVPGERGQV